MVLGLAACDGGGPDDDGAFRIKNGTEVNERNGAVQIRYPKRKADITDPAKPNRYCTGALIAEKCVITAGHCINVQNSEKEFMAGATIWHPDATNNDVNGRPEPKGNEVVAKVSAVKALGNEHRDLAVIKLDTALPGTTLVLARAQPDLDSIITILGNGQNADGNYAHAKGDMKLASTEESNNDAGYVSLVLAQIEATGALAKFGDSGGPAMFGGGIVGIGSRLKGNTEAYYASVTSVKSRAWLETEIKNVCGLAEIPVVPRSPSPARRRARARATTRAATTVRSPPARTARTTARRATTGRGSPRSRASRPGRASPPGRASRRTICPTSPPARPRARASRRTVPDRRRTTPPPARRRRRPAASTPTWT